MKKVYRRFLLAGSVVIFMLVAPALVLYAMGYRWTALGGAPQVGVLYIDTVPRGADIFINGQRVGSAPNAVSSLPAGPVQVEIRKAGYQPWHKNIFITPSTVTELRSVRLFPVTLVRQPLLPHLVSFADAPNQQTIAAITNDRAIHFLSGSEAVETIPAAHFKIQPEAVWWSTDNATLLMRNRAGAYYVLTTTPVLTMRSLPMLANASQVTWDPRVPDRIIFLGNNGTLNALTLSTGDVTILLDDVTMFSATSRAIVAARPQGQITILDLQGSVSQQLAVPSTEVITSLATTDAGLMAVITATKHIYVTNTPGVFTRLPVSAAAATWSPNGYILAIQSDQNTLYIYNTHPPSTDWLPVDAVHLVARFSRPFTQLAWLSDSRHVLYQLDDNLAISEIDTRDYPATFIVDTVNQRDASVHVLGNGDSVIYLKREGNQTILSRTFLTVQP